MTELQERKRLIVLQSDLHRALVRAEVANVRAQWGWLIGARAQARSAGLWLGLGTSALGLWAAWRGHRLARWIPAAQAAWTWYRKYRQQ
jgi:hypothetical protein